MENVNPIHRYKMLYGTRRIYAENVRAAPLQQRPAYNPQKVYPYFIAKMRQERGPRTTLSTRNPRFVPGQPAYIHNEAFNPDTWWNAEMRNKRPWVVAVESPYKGWPQGRLQSGILV